MRICLTYIESIYYPKKHRVRFTAEGKIHGEKPLLMIGLCYKVQAARKGEALNYEKKIVVLNIATAKIHEVFNAPSR